MINKRNLKRDSRGVTLIELMAVIAMIGILAGITLVSLGGQRERAQDTKILAELSATIQPMLMCQSDNGDVQALSAGDDICDLGTNYGKWPILDSGFSYVGDSVSEDWFFYVEGNKNRICCNKASKKCGLIDSEGACNAISPQL